jgi:hypothetical protein
MVVVISERSVFSMGMSIRMYSEAFDMMNICTVKERTIVTISMFKPYTHAPICLRVRADMRWPTGTHFNKLTNHLTF